MVFVMLYPYLLATGQYISLRVKYDRSKQFLHGRLYIGAPNNAAIFARDIIVDKVHTNSIAKS